MSDAPILVVDDDPAILHTVSEILSYEGYNVTTAVNGQDALDVLDRDRPWLVLLDMRMPVMDGWGFARALDERQIQVPILVMTAARSAQEWSEEIGAAGFVAKPFDIGDLLDAVAQLRPTS